MKRNAQKEVRTGIVCWRVLLPLVFAWTLLVAPVSCRNDLPEQTTPTGAYKRYVMLLASGKHEAVYDILVKEARETIARTHENIRRCKEMIERHYPEALRAQALADLGPPEVRDAPTPARFYAAQMGGRTAPRLTVMDQLKFNVRRVAKTQDGTVVITSVAGDQFEWIEGGDGRYYLVPNDKESARLRDEFLSSVRRLQAIADAVKTFERSR